MRKACGTEEGLRGREKIRHALRHGFDGARFVSGVTMTNLALLELS